MIRAPLLLLLFASAVSAAPVPKEVRAAPSHVGTWEHVALDPRDPAKRTPNGRSWVVDADCGVAIRNHPDDRPKPTERFAFDPKTGEVNHTIIGGAQRMFFGIYKIEGDLLTIQLSTGSPSIRPKGFAREPNCHLFTLRRVEDSK